MYPLISTHTHTPFDFNPLSVSDHINGTNKPWWVEVIFP